MTEKWIDEKIKGGQAVYDRMYDKYESELKDLDEQLALIPLNDESLEKYLNFGVSVISNLDTIFEKADIKTKKMFLGSILSENLVFDGEKYRTLEFNPAIALLSKYTNGFRNMDTKKGDNFSTVSHMVLGAGLEPARANAHRILSPACLPIPPSKHS